MKLTWFKRPHLQRRADALKAKLAKYPQPFTVHRFVDKMEVHDANGSELRYFHSTVEEALNLFAEAEIDGGEVHSD